MRPGRSRNLGAIVLPGKAAGARNRTKDIYFEGTVSNGEVNFNPAEKIQKNHNRLSDDGGSYGNCRSGSGDGNPSVLLW